MKDIQLIKLPISYKVVAFELASLMRKVAFLLSLIFICMMHAGVWGKDSSTCSACTLDWSYLSSTYFSEEVSWNRYPISSSVKVTSLLSAETTRQS